MMMGDDTVVFSRKAPHLTALKSGDWPEHEHSTYVVEQVIELPVERFAVFAGDLLADYDFIADHRSCMGVDTDGVWHCLLVKAEGTQDGILVNAEGHAWARYAAYCPKIHRQEQKRGESRWPGRSHDQRGGEYGPQQV